MDKFSYLLNDFLRVTDDLSAFAGKFFYAPFGIDSPDAVNTFTMSFAIGSVCYFFARHRQAVTAALRDRQANEFGLLRTRRRRTSRLPGPRTR